MFITSLRQSPPGLRPRDRTRTSIMKKIILLAGVVVAATVASNALAADAKATYEKDCAKCHGTDGKGDTKMGKKQGARDYTDAKVQADLKDAAAIKGIKEGVKNKDG